MKTRPVLMGSLIIPLLVLSSCGAGYKIYDRFELNKDSHYRDMRIDGTGYVSEAYHEILKYDDPDDELYENPYYYQINEVKTIAVLVDFEDTQYKAANMTRGEANMLSDLNKVILGEASDTQWQSLKSYFHTTSFGICNVSGTVVPEVYHTGLTVTEFSTYNGASKDNPSKATDQLAKDIKKWLNDKGTYNMKDYDSNKDGLIDSLIMIYTAPPHCTNPDTGAALNDDLFWAYCSSVNSQIQISRTNPGVDRYFWTSYETFFENGHYDEQGNHLDWTTEEIENGTAKLDAHTLIHEFGHVLSLPDYYNGDYDLHGSNADAYDPLLALDMQAYNIGDANAFSKSLYGWTTPYVVEDNCTITIKSTTETGEFIIVPVQGKYEGTLLSQYLMIEYLTPTELTMFDGTYKLGGNYPKYYSEPGVRVCLVDARPGMFSRSTGKFTGFTASTVMTDSYYIKFACDNNSISRSCYPNLKLIEIVPNSKTGNYVTARYHSTGQADNSCLYHQGDVWGRGKCFPNFYVHGNSKFWSQPTSSKAGQGQKLGFSFKIEKMNEDGVTISFSRV